MLFFFSLSADVSYFGVDIGPLSTLMHKVSGRVFVVNYNTLFIKKFNFDGEAPGKIIGLSYWPTIITLPCSTRRGHME